MVAYSVVVAIDMLDGLGAFQLSDLQQHLLRNGLWMDDFVQLRVCVTVRLKVYALGQLEV